MPIRHFSYKRVPFAIRGLACPPKRRSRRACARARIARQMRAQKVAPGPRRAPPAGSNRSIWAPSSSLGVRPVTGRPPAIHCPRGVAVGCPPSSSPGAALRPPPPGVVAGKDSGGGPFCRFIRISNISGRKGHIPPEPGIAGSGPGCLGRLGAQEPAEMRHRERDQAPLGAVDEPLLDQPIPGR